MKRRTIITSVLVIVLCLGLISGSTFALFTSEDSVNIAVTSGKVKLTATLDTLKVYSANPYLTEGTLVDKIDPTDTTGTLTGTFAGTYYYEQQSGTTFKNGGTAVISDSDQTLTLTNVTPGDKVSVNVNIENSSNVKIKYRIRVNVLENENEETASSLDLFNGLVTKIDGTVLNGVIRVNNWTLVDPSVNNGEIADVPVEIYLPLDAGNEYQDKTTQIRIIVEAVQNNAATQTELETINDYLAAQSPKNPTMYDAILDVQSALSLATYADAFAKVQDYLWNVDTDRFYVVSEEDGFEYKYFKAYTYDEFSALTAQTYSVYAYNDGITSWNNQNVNVVVGFDAGVTTDISSVSFARTGEYGKEFVIRTNSAATTLTINAPKDTINHYGTSGTVNIIAVAGSSYHENGKVAFVEIANGRLALEKDSKVSRIHFASTEVEQGEATDKVFNEIVVSYDSSLENNLPDFSRDDVEIPTQGKLVVELQKVDNTQEETETTSDFIWLTKQGIFEQIKVSGEGDKISEGAKWADDGAVDDDTQKASFQIANNIGRDNQGNIDVKVTVIESSETKNYEVSLNENRDLVVYESNSTSTEPVATLSSVGEVTIGSVDYTIALTNTTENSNNTTELVVTNTSTQESTTQAVVANSGLSGQDKEDAKQEAIEEVSTEQLSDDAYAAKIVGKSVGYETIQSAINVAENGDVIKLLNDTTETISVYGKTLTLDLNEKTLTHGAEDHAVTVYDTNGVMVKNGTINGQIRIGEHQYTKVKWKDYDGTIINGYHPLAPAKSVELKDLTIASGDKVALYFTNIEDDLTRANATNPFDQDLYGQYIYKTGYQTYEQSQNHNNNRNEIFTVCTDKDHVTVTNCTISSNVNLVGNMHDINNNLYTDVLEVKSGTFNNDSLGRFVSIDKYLVGTASNTYVVADSAPSTYTGKINKVYYTYEGGANKAIAYANFGETVYITENANQEKIFDEDENGNADTLIIYYEAENIAYTGATAYNATYDIVDDIETIQGAHRFYAAFQPVAAVYATGQGGNWKTANKVGEYGTLKDAFAALSNDYTVVILKDFTVDEEQDYKYSNYTYKCAAGWANRSTVDFNGYIITYTGTGACLVSSQSSGLLYFKDTSGTGRGGIIATQGYCFRKLHANTDHVYFNGGKFVSQTKSAIAFDKKGNSINFSGGYYEGTSSWVSTIGNITLNITGGTFVPSQDSKTSHIAQTDANGTGTACLVESSMIKMADGTLKPVEQVKAGDVLLVLDHETGNISSSRVLFNDSEPKDNYLVLNLYFSNGSTVKIVDEHGFFDLDLMKYVYITDENYSNYIGHQFYGVDGNVTLVSAYLTEEVVELYSPVTEVTLNYFVEGLLSMPGGIEGMFNIFDYDSELKFDKQNDIDTYGLLDYEYFEDMIPYDIYVVFNGKYLNIAMQKGILTEQKLSQYIERYSVYWTE